MDASSGLQTKLFGLNKRQVEEYFTKQHKNHLEKMELFKHALEDGYQKRDILSQKLVQLTRDREVLLEEKELLELALLRAKHTVALLKDSTAKEIEEIFEKAKEQKDNCDKKISELETDINSTKLFIDTLIENVTKLIKQQESPREEEAYSGKVVGSIYPSLNKKEKSSTEKQSERKENEKEDEKAEKLWQDKKMTADGLMLSNFNAELNDNERQYRDFLDKVSKVLTEPNSEDKIEDKNEDTKPLSVSFWEETGIEEAATTSENIVVQNHELNKTGQFNDTSSPIMTEEINTIRYKYIVGKIAGENLLGSDGKLIIAKNSVITAEIVDSAEKQGKLPELIVNMNMPGLEN